jgi:hypothetical protein
MNGNGRQRAIAVIYNGYIDMSSETNTYGSLQAMAITPDGEKSRAD